jgi:DNA mismatch endonuclease (patch repair protein)
LVSDARLPKRHADIRFRAVVSRKAPVSVDVSARMRRVRRVNTNGERMLHSALKKRGLRFSTHTRVLDCRPDVIFREARVAVFVDGDFWHGRVLIEHGRKALSKTFATHIQEFWVNKIERNVTRDQRQVRRLRRHGWSVIRIWERDVLVAPDYYSDIVEGRVRSRS